MRIQRILLLLLFCVVCVRCCSLMLHAVVPAVASGFGHVTFSSTLDGSTGQHFRLNQHANGAHAAGAWVALDADGVGEWAQITFPVPVNVVAVATQGRQDAEQWVSEYEVHFSDLSTPVPAGQMDIATPHPTHLPEWGHGPLWHRMTLVGSHNSFPGNSNADHIVHHYVEGKAQATRSVKFVPVKCHEACAMRFEVYIRIPQ